MLTIELENKYKTFFELFFDKVSEEYKRRIHYKPEDELPSGEIARKKVVETLLPLYKIAILRLNIDVQNYPNTESKIFHVIKFDFSDSSETSIKYLGKVDLSGLPNQFELRKQFELDDGILKPFMELRISCYGEFERRIFVLITPYDILENSERYVSDFLTYFFAEFGDKILKYFEKVTDYNSKYDLKPNLIVSIDELTKRHRVFDSMKTMDKNGKFREVTIEDFQKAVAEIQLIPTVPEEVKRLFDGAKKLFIYGYFQYYFMTISFHYALFALESALRNRYIQAYGKLSNATNLDTIIDKLEQKRIIPKGEKDMFKIAKELRNAFSHPTVAPILPAHSEILKRLANHINSLFDNEK